jgi:DNA-directed RNA polymerase subunit beta
MVALENGNNRRDYSKLDPAWLVEIPHLLDVQLRSFQSFLQGEIPGEERALMGLQEVFHTVFPISDTRNFFSLEFVSYTVGEPKYSTDECQERDLTFSAPLKATLRLRIREDIEGEKRDKEIIEQEVYLGELPLLTDKGTFIINGAERVIVSQLHRSPGVFFDDTVHPNGKRLFSSRIIPYRGSWVEFTLDVNDIMYVHIDRKRKLPVTVLLKALGYVSEREILELFYGVETAALGSGRTKKEEALEGRVVAEDIVDTETGEILLETNEEVSLEKIKELAKAGIKEIKLFEIPLQEEADIIRNTLKRDASTGEDDALARIYALLRPGEPPRAETAREILNRLFFNPKRYDLAKVGRFKLNKKLNHVELLGGGDRLKHLNLAPVDDETTTLSPIDFVSIIMYLLKLRTLQPEVTTDDIDHLGNRRVRSVGELLANQFNIGLTRMARIIRERMSLQDSENITPYDLVNARTISAVIQSFFGSSQLSQFMDQTNPLSELTHKRRLSALGPGGLTRDRAGFEVRDVHYTHYGRMCPIETPEGPNIGLISSLATYARVNDMGFLETPYRKVAAGVVQKDDIEFISADVEDRAWVAQANQRLDAKGGLDPDGLLVRHRGEVPAVTPDEVDFMDLSPIQIVSPAAALIPFLEHDDANRALMGSNMQRQAVPLLRTEAPLVGTGLEAKVARDSGAVLTAKRGGVVESVFADAVVVKYDRPKGERRIVEFDAHSGLDIYPLQKFKRSNQDTCINQRPLVREGQRVEENEPLADGAATSGGELALGANVIVAFMPWGGYNFEDAILVSERLVRDDVFTSIHIEEFELQVRDTNRGVEEITREIPNVGEEAVANLDEEGIIRIGAPVRAGDILVGKVTPKGETDLSPEERLLRAIFGEKAGDVRDASLKAPPGMEGIVIDIKVFSRREKDETARKSDKKKVERLKRYAKKERSRIIEIRDTEIADLLDGQAANRFISARTGEELIKTGGKITRSGLGKIDLDELPWNTPLTRSRKVNETVWKQMEEAQRAIDRIEREMEKDLEKITRGDELPPGVVKLVKVFIAKKRRLSVGDKMAGRHGNKGVVSKVLPVEDMPYLKDGTPVDMVLNPLGVPSRMNIGQILEAHLGWAARSLGITVATPVFAGATVEEIKATLSEAGLPTSGKSVLFDGRSGEKFHQEVTVGIMYMLKLSHLVDDKIHARSIGPYSLVTQQPLGGKAQFGGQRFGEMEVWALEAYGAAFTLQEMLTVKSDDVPGRSRVYEAIVKGENPPEPGIPESFNVLVKELQSLCLDVEFLAP